MGLYVEQPHGSALQLPENSVITPQSIRVQNSPQQCPHSDATDSPPGIPSAFGKFLLLVPPRPVSPASASSFFHSFPPPSQDPGLQTSSKRGESRVPTHPPGGPDCKRPRKEGNQECPPTRPGARNKTEKTHIITLAPIHWAPLPTRLHRQAPGPGILAPIPRCSIFCMRMTSRSMTLHGAKLSGVYSASSGHENTQNGPLFIIREYSPMTAPFRNPIPVL